MTTVRDAVIMLIGLEDYRQAEVLPPIRRELEKPCSSWNLKFVSIGRSDINKIPYHLDRRKDIEVIYVMNDIDMGYKHLLSIGERLADAVPKCASRPQMACESSLFDDILTAALRPVGLVIYKSPLHTTVRSRYAELHPTPQLKLVSAA